MNYEKEISNLKDQLSVFRGMSLFSLAHLKALRALIVILEENRGTQLHSEDDFSTVLRKMELEYVDMLLPFLADYAQTDASIIKEEIDKISKRIIEDNS
jgi:hypothetical protein